MTVPDPLPAPAAVFRSEPQAAVLATALALAPVSVHRSLFRHGAKSQIVSTGNRLAIVTLGVISLVLTGTVTFVFDVVLGDTAALVAAIGAGLVLLLLWVVLPLSVRPRVRAEPQPPVT